MKPLASPFYKRYLQIHPHLKYQINPLILYAPSELFCPDVQPKDFSKCQLTLWVWKMMSTSIPPSVIIRFQVTASTTEINKAEQDNRISFILTSNKTRAPTWIHLSLTIHMQHSKNFTNALSNDINILFSFKTTWTTALNFKTSSQE